MVGRGWWRDGIRLEKKQFRPSMETFTKQEDNYFLKTARESHFHSSE